MKAKKTKKMIFLLTCKIKSDILIMRLTEKQQFFQKKKAKKTKKQKNKKTKKSVDICRMF